MPDIPRLIDGRGDRATRRFNAHLARISNPNALRRKIETEPDVSKKEQLAGILARLEQRTERREMRLAGMFQFHHGRKTTIHIERILYGIGNGSKAGKPSAINSEITRMLRGLAKCVKAIADTQLTIGKDAKRPGMLKEYHELHPQTPQWPARKAVEQLLDAMIKPSRAVRSLQDDIAEAIHAQAADKKQLIEKIERMQELCLRFKSLLTSPVMDDLRASGHDFRFTGYSFKSTCWDKKIVECSALIKRVESEAQK